MCKNVISCTTRGFCKAFAEPSDYTKRNLYPDIQNFGNSWHCMLVKASSLKVSYMYRTSWCIEDPLYRVDTEMSKTHVVKFLSIWFGIPAIFNPIRAIEASQKRLLVACWIASMSSLTKSWVRLKKIRESAYSRSNRCHRVWWLGQRWPSSNADRCTQIRSSSRYMQLRSVSILNHRLPFWAIHSLWSIQHWTQ